MPIQLEIESMKIENRNFRQYLQTYILSAQKISNVCSFDFQIT